MQLSDFDYSLPPERIAQAPVSPRDASRLLHVQTETLADKTFRDLPSLLRADDLLVFNNTKVIPAQLHGIKNGLNGENKIGVTLLKRTDSDSEIWECFAKPSRKLSIDDVVVFDETLQAKLLNKTAEGKMIFQFAFSAGDFITTLERVGQMPLPPYIKRDGKNEADDSSYQTVFAEKSGAVAAPTAGLHFNEAMLEKLTAKGIEFAHVTLHVGGGTFLPVRHENLDDHQMHSEWIELDATTAQQINRARAAGRRIVSIGTTSLRCLESCTDDAGQIFPFTGETDIFITPGYPFKCVDVLLTNFHLPRSTLFMLVSAFCGLDKMKAAYAHAIAQEYRFFSYGDACLLER